MIGPSFEAVLAAAADGDELAFRAIWRDLQPALLRYLNAFAPGSGEDLASETWLRVVKGLPSFSGDERAFRAWVFTIARHRAVDRWRRGTRRHDELVPLDALAHLPAPDDPAGTVVDAISGQAAVAMIAALPPDQAEVVLLRVVAGLDVAEVAAITGKRPGNVRVLAHRALRRLAEQLAQQSRVGRPVSAGEGGPVPARRGAEGRGRWSGRRVV
jgi:RNA polymerase sigma-70 factor (ECF subfamily)